MTRIAASTRPFLFGLRGLVAVYALSVLARMLFSGFPGPTTPVVVLVCLAFWIYERSTSVWITARDGRIAVSRRNPWSWRTSGATITEHSAGAEVSYDDRGRWWRADRGLTIDGTRYSVYPEGRRLAADLASVRAE